VGNVERYYVNPEELAVLHMCLSSKLCMRIFRIISAEKGAINISAICRKAGCSTGNAKRHLQRLVRLGVVEEEQLCGLHIFYPKQGEMARLLRRTMEELEAEADKCALRGKA
jgi:DNA-binding IclR family transcriptional regulator